MPVDRFISVINPASTYDLTDLATVKDELAIPTNDTTKDAFLSRAISQVSAAIGNYCNRVFQVETVQEIVYPTMDAFPYQIPGNIAPLRLMRWPFVTAMLTFTTSGATSVGATVLPVVSTAGVVVGQPITATGIPVGAYVVGWAVNTSITISAATTAALPAGTSITLGMSISVSSLGTLSALTAGTDYLPDANTGLVTRLDSMTAYPTSWPVTQIVATYQAGYATIPLDIVDATLRAVSGRFVGRGRDPLLKSQEQPGIGHQTYWIGTAPGVRGAFTEEIADLLDNYRIPVTG